MGTARGRLRRIRPAHPFAPLLLLAVATLGQEKPQALVTLRLTSEPDRRISLWVHDADESGLRVRRLADARDRTLRWDEIVAEDRSRLRRRFRLDLTEREKRGEVDGVRLHLSGGGHVDGVLEKVDADGRHWLRRGGAVLPYPRDRIEEVESMLLDEIDVYGVLDLHRRLVERYRPDTPEEHLTIAKRMSRAGGFAHAVLHYEEAVRLDADLRWRVKPDLDACRALAKDEALARSVQRAGKLARLDHRYAEARALLARHRSSRFAIRTLEEIDELEADRLNREFHVRKNLLLRRMLDDYLRRKRPTLAEARAYVDGSIEQDLRERIKKELELSDEQLADFSRRGGSGAAHWATYGSGSFILDPFAKRGKGGRSATLGDPDAWWTRYDDVATRSAFLRAYAAERLVDLFRTTRIRYTPCESCGGTGKIEHGSVRPLKTLRGGHFWRETCPRCYGCGRDRVVAYR